MAFLMPDSGYKFAQRLQDTKKVPSTSKIYPILERLVKTGYLTYDKNKYHHNPVKITDDLIDYLEYNDVTIEENERKILQNMLTSGYFFNIISADVYDELTTRQSGSHDIDALEFFRNKIGLLSTIFSHLNKLNPQQDNPIRESFEKVNEDLTGMVEHVNKTMLSKLKGSASFKKKKLNSYDLFSNTLKSMILLLVLFQKIPDETLEKFAKLWDQHQGFALGSKLGQFNSIESLQKFCNDQMKPFENHNKT